MLHELGMTRSSLKADHLLQTPDTFIRIPMPGATGVEFIVHAAPRMGAAFTQMTAEFTPGSQLGKPQGAIERFLYVLEGDLELEVESRQYPLKSGSYAFLPHVQNHEIKAITPARVALIEKRYETTASAETPSFLIGNESDVPSEALGGDEDLQVRHLIPDGPTWDFAVNTMTYAPGASLSQVEIHVMEHGLLMLEGGGIYRLGDHWYPVTAGDFIWMAPYCPQWFGAIGKTPAKYLIYKDWYRHPLGG
jgi:(S)-ureidoglycine aminohydrolase